jgi:hypothetical protein
MLYMVTITINIPPMLVYIPYMDPMGKSLSEPRVPRKLQWIQSSFSGSALDPFGRHSAPPFGDGRWQKTVFDPCCHSKYRIHVCIIVYIYIFIKYMFVSFFIYICMLLYVYMIFVIQHLELNPVILIQT